MEPSSVSISSALLESWIELLRELCTCSDMSDDIGAELQIMARLMELTLHPPLGVREEG